jgi:hypothetical protein
LSRLGKRFIIIEEGAGYPDEFQRLLRDRRFN